MTQKELAKKLQVPSYHAEDKFWDMIEAKKLLKLVNGIKARTISSNIMLAECKHRFNRIINYRGNKVVWQCTKCGKKKIT